MSSFPNSNHLELIRQGQRSLADAQPLLDTAEACGLDCQQYRAGVQELGRRLALYQARLFPDSSVGGDGTDVPRAAGGTGGR